MTIVAEALTKRYDTTLAVDSLTLTVRSGEVFGFLGHNGAGKTTTMRMMVGLLKPTAGRALLDGHDVQRDPARAKRALGFVPDEPHLFDGLTGREFLRFIAEVYGLADADYRRRAADLIDRFALAEHIDQFIGGYSHGTRQKLALIGALIHRPANLLLDEPTVGLDPRATFTLKEILRAHAAHGGAVFLSTHILEIAEGVCDRVGVIDHGRLLAVGTVEELRARFDMPGASLERIFLRLTARPSSRDAASDPSVASAPVPEAS
ncbi:MAG: ABC transporter ATP-binding protein [Dehalococcoidia bacterium]|nr:ABC transporter ATP-binding protein [Dehalococcoidia bacterium]